MDINKNFKIKLIFPCRFEELNNLSIVFSAKNLPYGMCILTAFLRKQNVYVEQEDLSIKFNSYNFHQLCDHLTVEDAERPGFTKFY